MAIGGEGGAMSYDCFCDYEPAAFYHSEIRRAWAGKSRREQ